MATIFPSTPTIGDEYNGYSWDGTSWNLVGNKYNPSSYSASAPANPKPGDIWIESDVDVPSISPETILTTTAAASTYQPLVSGVSNTEIGYLDGVTSPIQTQINSVGLTQVIPTSLSVGSTGSATVATNGTITVSNGQWIIANGVFTSKYQNYKIIANVSPGSNQGINMRLTTGGTQNTSANYFSGGTYVFYAGGTYAYNGNSTTQILVGVDMNTGGNVAEMDVFNPQLSGPTQIHSMSSANSGYFSQINHIFNQGTQFDGFQLYAATAGIYGTIRVYGYNNG